MNVWQKIGIVGGGIILILMIIGMFLPIKRHLERSITINAPASAVFKEVNRLQRWQNWSPWRDIDPKATVTYEGPEAGVGCTMTWASERPQLGRGSQQIVVSEPNRRIVINLKFADWEGSVIAGWKFEEQAAGGTRVTWTNDSDNKGKLWAKYMDIIIYPKLGKNYEQGLQNLKTHVEKLHAQQQDTREEGAVAD